MKYPIRIFIFLALLNFSSSIFSTEKSQLKIMHWTLKNKAHVYFVQRKEIPMLDIETIFSAGSIYDKHEHGISTLTNAMIGEGAKKLSAEKISAEFEKVGAKFNTYSDRDMSVLKLQSLTKRAELTHALYIFSKVLTTPTFPIRSLMLVKKQMLTALKLQKSDAWNVANNAFYQKIYADFPYADNPLGTEKSIQSLTRLDVKKFYRKFYNASNVSLVMVGDISENKAKSIANRLVGKLPKGKKAPTFKSPKRQVKHSIQHVTYPSSQSTIVIGQLAIDRNNKNYFPLVVGNAIFGGLPLSSILYSEVREKRGYAYAASSRFNPLKYRGPFMLTLQTKASNTNDANALVKKLIRRFIIDGPTESQLTAAKKSLSGRFPLAISSNSNIASVLSRIAFYHLPINYLDTYRKNINAVTLEKLKNSFKNTIDPDALSTVIVGPNHLPVNHNDK